MPGEEMLRAFQFGKSKGKYCAFPNRRQTPSCKNFLIHSTKVLSSTSRELQYYSRKFSRYRRRD